MKPLAGKVAVVTGASRGIGKGIALELGAAGATVYITGRTVTAGQLPGTIAQTAAEVTALGGTGVAIACDHHDDEQVKAVFAKVEADHGHLDILVNNVFSAPDVAPWLNRPFWNLPVEAWDQVIDIGLRSHYVASVFAAPLLLKAARPAVIVNISSPGSTEYSHNVVYGVGKAGVDKMTADMAHELRPHDIAVVSVWPGLVRTELLESAARVTEDGARVLDIPGAGTFDIGLAESPRYVGAAVAALAADPDVLAHSGKAESTAKLTETYGLSQQDSVQLRARSDS